MTGNRPGRTRIALLAVGLVAASLSAGGWLLVRAGRTASEPLRPTRLFQQVLEHIRRFGVDSLGDAELFRRAASGLMLELDDEFATLRPAGDRREWPADVGGLGILLTARGGSAAVLSVVPDSPAEVAGLRARDQLVEIEGGTLNGLARDGVLEALNGAPGTQVKLRVRRAGVGPLLEFELERTEPKPHWMTDVVDLGGGVRYVGVRLMGGDAAKELRRVLRDDAGRATKGLVLDLRNASGGDLDVAVAISSLFLRDGSPTVTVRGREGEGGGAQSRVTRGGGDFQSLPLVVLVNSNTADAAEVVAGALQDNDRALVVGQPSFGRGVSTARFPLDNRMVVQLSTARWVTPSGRAIQPDTLSAPADTLARRPIYRTLAGRPVRGGGGIVPDSLVVPRVGDQAEQVFLRAVGAALPDLEAALREVAGDLAASGRVTLDFEPATGDLEALRQALAAQGVNVNPAAWVGGQSYLARELGDRAVLQALGRPVFIRRRVGREPALGLAVRLLRGADRPADLLGLAGESTTVPPP
jgi:carboxyl-terminal processing protease